MKKNKKVAIITGAAGGIGRATAIRFARERYRVMLSDINRQGLETLLKELESGNPDSDFLISPGDLSNLSFAKSVVDQCTENWGRIDVLVNNAVWRTHETMRTLTIDNWEKTLKINLTAPAFLSKWVGGVMEDNQTKGVIINISSIMSNRAGGTAPAYVVCKGGMESLTYELASLYGPSGIRVVAVAPGNVQTSLSNDFLDASGENISVKMEKNMCDQTPLKRSAQPDEIANAIYWLSSSEATFVTGTVIQVDGGFSHGFNHYSLKKSQFPKEF